MIGRNHRAGLAIKLGVPLQDPEKFSRLVVSCCFRDTFPELPTHRVDAAQCFPHMCHVDERASKFFCAERPMLGV